MSEWMNGQAESGHAADVDAQAESEVCTPTRLISKNAAPKAIKQICSPTLLLSGATYGLT